MTGYLRSRATVIWALLVAATLLSWWLGTDHGIANARAASSLVLVVAFVKIRYVGLDFMELRNAPLPLRGLFEGWCAAVCATLVAMFLLL